jgi:hypothetical protein
MEMRDALAETIEQLGPLVEAGLPGLTPCAFAFQQAAYGEVDDYTPTIAQMQRAIGEYLKLPEPVRWGILNGWRVALTERPTQRELEAMQAGLVRTVVMALKIYGSPRGGDSSLGWEFHEMTHPVLVQIRAGTTKAEALNSLREIARAVRDHYATMIATEYTSVEKLDADAARQAIEAAQKARCNHARRLRAHESEAAKRKAA